MGFESIYFRVHLVRNGGYRNLAANGKNTTTFMGKTLDRGFHHDTNIDFIICYTYCLTG
ncbi:hypothetical protein XCR1_1040039 [Xenorhabdus cabanillasii JM26]|uniref:Uncharacterized protein n=1 Tax=Xenorhabdus cabanillasii JM26 TaxID=1427517 RepID=W1IL03_9GAMM|nr:hypothetical protein XCR1_1040039 [Xenorhabdus cabanillasii JM26]